MAVETATPAYMQPPRRVRRPRRGYTKTALIAWLDEQERLIRMRARPTEVVKEFDPLENLPEPQDERGRQTILFRFNANLESSIADQIQAKIVENVRSRFMLKLSATVELRHTEEAARKMDFYQRDNGSSPWFETLETRPEFCLWTPIGTIVASSAASPFIGVRMCETICAKPENLRNPFSPSVPVFVTA